MDKKIRTKVEDNWFFQQKIWINALKNESPKYTIKTRSIVFGYFLWYGVVPIHWMIKQAHSDILLQYAENISTCKCF